MDWALCQLHGYGTSEFTGAARLDRAASGGMMSSASWRCLGNYVTGIGHDSGSQREELFRANLVALREGKYFLRLPKISKLGIRVATRPTHEMREDFQRCLIFSGQARDKASQLAEIMVLVLLLFRLVGSNTLLNDEHGLETDFKAVANKH